MVSKFCSLIDTDEIFNCAFWFGLVLEYLFKDLTIISPIEQVSNIVFEISTLTLDNIIKDLIKLKHDPKFKGIFVASFSVEEFRDLLELI